MNCQQINKEELHEKYLFGQLSAERQKEYEQHLSKCQICSDELEVQKQLISGIRYTRRMTMKEEIISQAQSFRESSWSDAKNIFMRAAAVLLIAVFLPGVYYYYNHYAGLPEEKSVPITAPDYSVESDMEVVESGREDEVVVAPPAPLKAVQIKSGRGVRSIEKKQKQLESLLEDEARVTPSAKSRAAGAGGGVIAGDAGSGSEKGETSKMMLEELEFDVMNELPAAVVEESIEEAAPDVMGLSAVSQKRRAKSKTVLASMEHLEPVKIRHQNGVIEFIAQSYSDEMIIDSLYHYISQDSLIRIYWPDIPQKYLQNSAKLKIDQESLRKFILLFDDKKVYQFYIDTEKVRIIKIEE